MDRSLAKVRAAARAVERAEARYRAALDARDEAIRDALDERYSMAKIAEVAGVSRNQVFNISQGRRISTRPDSKGARGA